MGGLEQWNWWDTGAEATVAQEPEPGPRVVTGTEANVGQRYRTFTHDPGIWGGSPGNRTLNLRIKSPLLCLVELATPSGIVVAQRGSARREGIVGAGAR